MAVKCPGLTVSCSPKTKNKGGTSDVLTTSYWLQLYTPLTRLYFVCGTLPKR